MSDDNTSKKVSKERVREVVKEAKQRESQVVRISEGQRAALKNTTSR